MKKYNKKSCLKAGKNLKRQCRKENKLDLILNISYRDYLKYCSRKRIVFNQVPQY